LEFRRIHLLYRGWICQAYDDFIIFADKLGLSRTISERIIKEFINKEQKSFELLEKSFLSVDAKTEYKRLFLDRLRAINYRFESKI